MFYVYELVDPRDGSVFYVGKGKGGRIDAHEGEARKGKRSRKCQRIRDIWEAGEQIGKRIVARFDNEDEAFDCEIDRIASYGLDNLTNVLPGGQGKSQPGAMTPEQWKAKIKARLLRSKIDAMGERFRWGAVFPFEPNGIELGKVFWRALRALTGGEPAEPWKQVNPKPFTVLGVKMDGPTPIDVLLELATSNRSEEGTKMSALRALVPYCLPMGPNGATVQIQA